MNDAGGKVRRFSFVVVRCHTLTNGITFIAGDINGCIGMGFSTGLLCVFCYICSSNLFVPFVYFMFKTKRKLLKTWLFWHLK